MRRLLISITALAVLGVAVSSYALWQHYAPLGAAFCNISETFSCDIVNKSDYSELFGIPIAIIGILGYAAIAALTLGAWWERRIVSNVSPPPTGRGGVRGWGTPIAWLLAFSLLGLAFQGVYTYIEIWRIGAYCPICIVSQALILAITALAAIAWWRRRKLAHVEARSPNSAIE